MACRWRSRHRRAEEKVCLMLRLIPLQAEFRIGCRHRRKVFPSTPPRTRFVAQCAAAEQATNKFSVVVAGEVHVNNEAIQVYAARDVPGPRRRVLPLFSAASFLLVARNCSPCSSTGGLQRDRLVQASRVRTLRAPYAGTEIACPIFCLRISSTRWHRHHQNADFPLRSPANNRYERPPAKIHGYDRHRRRCQDAPINADVAATRVTGSRERRGVDFVAVPVWPHLRGHRLVLPVHPQLTPSRTAA